MTDHPTTEATNAEVGCPHNSWGVIVQCPVCGTPRAVSPRDYSTPHIEAEERRRIVTEVRELADACEELLQYVRIGPGPLGDDPAAAAMRRAFDALGAVLDLRGGAPR